MSVLDESVASSFRFFRPSEKSEGLFLYRRPLRASVPFPSTQNTALRAERKEKRGKRKE